MSVWSTLFLLNVSTALKGTDLYILFVVTAACVVPCGGPKKYPRTSSIVQFIFCFWSFEIGRNILRIRTYYRFRLMVSKHVFTFWPQLGIISVIETTAFLKLEIKASTLWFSLPVHSMSLKRIYYSKQFCLAYPFLFECFQCSYRNLSLYFIFHSFQYYFKPVFSNHPFRLHGNRYGQVVAYC